MNNKLREIVTKLNVARSVNCNEEKSEEIKNIIYELLPYCEFEEELGIDLVTLFKALKNGVYYFVNGTQLTKDYVWIVDDYMSVGTPDKLSYSFITAFEKRILSFNDYGKTWALTKEELL